MFVYCVLKLPALSKDLKPLVAAIGPVHVDLCVASDRVPRVELVRLSAFRAPRLQELAVLIKLSDARIAVAIGTKAFLAAFRATSGGRLELSAGALMPA